ncbi:heavy-metal-associated domain-containing protein [Steroidobacter sp. S1-65]|uniref:Heavy-metal-associated domain-containing protein n=1 Tax=Steroidobacter gossypii TaxID=2805490 RepID=A0ABS1WUU2_9GAMM|nr:heavy-metal-associated domain-containing protein [Steroidobacter gossypii]MBM0104736.1 heavy-metal-associated domain-containing protein [Steroidobacter gossypii]
MRTSNFLLAFTLLATGADATTIEMKVNGLVCSFCAQGIEKTLRKNPATQDVLVSLENRLVAIVTKDGTDIADADLRKALTDAGYDVKAIERTQRSMDELRSRLKQSQ